MAAKREALCVGINNYGGSGDLSGCVNDALDWSSLLGSRGYKVVALLDEEATKDNIRRTILATLARLKSGDKFVFTFSGHGSNIPDLNGDEDDERDEVLCCVDYRRGGLFTDDELNAVFATAARGTQVTFISDSCHSATIHRFADTDGGKARFLPPSTFVDDLPRQRTITRPTPKPSNVLLLAGCEDDSVSYDAWFGGRANGAFTRAAIDTFVPRTKVRDWHARICTLLPSRRFPQSPQLQGSWMQRRRFGLG